MSRKSRRIYAADNGLSIEIIIAVEDTPPSGRDFRALSDMDTRAHVKSVCKRDETENISFPSANPRRRRRGDVTAALSSSAVIHRRGMHFTARRNSQAIPK